MDEVKVYTEKVIKQRANNRIPLEFIKKYISSNTTIYIGGNSLNISLPNDIDLFPSIRGQFENLEFENDVEVICKTANATTLKFGGKVIQLCNYLHPDIQSLVESFDFAHIKLGAEISIKEQYLEHVDKTIKTIKISKVYISDDWYKAKTSGKTFFTGSQYPLSSMLRLFKYFKRGELPGISYKLETVKIITAIAHRGFQDYGDFKNQLDAIDLQLIHQAGFDFQMLIDLFNEFVISSSKDYNRFRNGISEEDKNILFDYTPIVNDEVEEI